jgi:hypothetical protein
MCYRLAKGSWESGTGGQCHGEDSKKKKQTYTMQTHDGLCQIVPSSVRYEGKINVAVENLRISSGQGGYVFIPSNSDVAVC